MSLLLSQLPWRLCLGKPVLIKSSPPCNIPCGRNLGKLVIVNAANESDLEKTVALKKRATIGSSNGWRATLKDGRVRLEEDQNPYTSGTDWKHILLPPLVTLPDCQTQIVTNVEMSSSSPEEEECVVAVKFLGPQLSFCRPAQSNSEWINIRIENPCFFPSRVKFSKKNDMFLIPGSGGQLIGSWAHNKNPKFQKLLFKNLPKLTKDQRERLYSCYTSEHLVESTTSHEIFLVKWYRNTLSSILDFPGLKTDTLMVFKLDEQGNAIYTQDIGEHCIYLSMSESFCISASTYPLVRPNRVIFYDFDELVSLDLADYSFTTVDLIIKNPWCNIVPYQYAY